MSEVSFVIIPPTVLPSGHNQHGQPHRDCSNSSSFTFCAAASCCSSSCSAASARKQSQSYILAFQPQPFSSFSQPVQSVISITTPDIRCSCSQCPRPYKNWWLETECSIRAGAVQQVQGCLLKLQCRMRANNCSCMGSVLQQSK